MKPYLVSLAVGVLVGILYASLQVRSPAPPFVALLGLLGMLLGEQSVAVVKRMHGTPTEVRSVPAASAEPGAHVIIGHRSDR